MMAQATAQQPERRWIYNQSTGQLRTPDGRLVQVRGYSGWHTPEYRNNPAAEREVDRGPIQRTTLLDMTQSFQKFWRFNFGNGPPANEGENIILLPSKHLHLIGF